MRLIQFFVLTTLLCASFPHDISAEELKSIAEAKPTPTGPPYRPSFSESQINAERFEAPLRPTANKVKGKGCDQVAKSIPARGPKTPQRVRSQIELLEAACLYLKGNYKDAAAELKELLKSNPSNSDAMYLMSASQAQLGKMEDAKRYLDEAVWFGRATIFDQYLFSVELARILRSGGQAEKAMQLLSKLTTDNPTRAEGLLELAQLQFDAGAPVDANASLVKGLALKPDDTQLTLLTAQQLITNLNRDNTKSNSAEAAKLCDKVLADTKLDEATRRSASFTKLRALVNAGELDSADNWAKQLGKNYKSDPQLARLQQQIVLERKMIEEAKEKTKEEEEAAT